MLNTAMDRTFSLCHFSVYCVTQGHSVVSHITHWLRWNYKSQQNIAESIAKEWKTQLTEGKIALSCPEIFKKSVFLHDRLRYTGSANITQNGLSYTGSADSITHNRLRYSDSAHSIDVDTLVLQDVSHMIILDKLTQQTESHMIGLDTPT